jgi:hypothetical protein
VRRRRARAGMARLRPVPILSALGLLGALALAGVLPGPGAPRAAAQGEAEKITLQTDASIPARNVMMIGATPEEIGAPGANETWGLGVPSGSASESAGPMLLRYTSAGGWTLGLALESSAGQAFKLDGSPLAGQMTPSGAGVLAGTVPGEARRPREVLLVRNPGDAFQETGEAPSLGEGEALFDLGRAPLIAPLDEGGGRAGALVVPVREETQGVESSVLHWDGSHWTREAIEIPANSREDLRVLAIGASSPANAWLLAQLSSKSYPSGSVALFRRVPRKAEGAQAAGWAWMPVAPSVGGGEAAHPLAVPVSEGEPRPFTISGTGEPPKVTDQVLTVTSAGVWVDGERSDVRSVTPASTTIFFKPAREAAIEGETPVGQVTASWCFLPASAPAGTPECDHRLPLTLPTGLSRSIAWPHVSPSNPYGERVITGLPEGVSLRLEGTEFREVLGLGATAGAPPGGALGAAFSNATEGWMGAEGLPVHLTLSPGPSRLTPWPVPFRHALTAIAPQPGAPVGSLSSEALAVGDQGEVARLRPGEGWLPESLFGPGGRIETPRLRAVAWPTPQRAYAVGDYGQMWLWRGETGLWERDPATPANFRGNLLGVAFDPGNPARGYAVGSAALGLGDVLLRYGKTWTEVPACGAGVSQPCIPPEAAGASFTSIAFAGSEAIIAYRRLLNPEHDVYTGGLLVNAGSGWQVDQAAAAALGANAPVAVAALPDGGAAFTSSGPEGTRVFEREAAGASWQPTPTPLPGSVTGSLALFREGGALRAIAAGGGAIENYEQEREPAPPPGFPPNLTGPYPVGYGSQASGLLRQTATGWSDQSHELNPVSEPEGSYVFYDLPYRPEPVFAVLTDPTGAQGWAVGGEIHSESRTDTASIERYPADGVPPPGAGSSQVQLNAQDATFAIGGGAQCAAACADRALAGIGPDVWLTAALARARQVGVRAFIYTGPRLTTDQATGLTKPVVPFAHEFARYASIIASGLPAYVAPSPEDLDARPESQGTEAKFKEAFANEFSPSGKPGTLEALGTGLPVSHGGQLGEGAPPSCASTVGCEGAYYALESPGPAGTVRVIVLDDTQDVDSTQLEWLAGQLNGAKVSREPAIAVGNADLNAQIAAGDVQAAEVARVLVGDGASAYFYNSPEADVSKPLRAGGGSIPTFGSGTLGYVNVVDEHAGDFHGASGFLLGELDVAGREPATNRAPVTVRLIPNIGELALEAKDGILLRRSQPALFDALARRPRAGSRAHSGEVPLPEVDPYIPIPSNCVGSGCAIGVFPEYTFSSSRPDIGGFVKPNLTSSDPHAVLDTPAGQPVHEPINPQTGVEESKSGLFCAYNPGTTIVTISAGGLSSSLPVTVQAGSVRQPCGTVPLKEVRANQRAVAAPPPPPPAPAAAGPTPAATPPVPLPPPPPAAAPAKVRPAPTRPVPAPPFFLPPAAPVALIAFVPPPLIPAANPTPPSGTSAVTSPVEAAQREEEEEEATESASNQAVAYRTGEHEPSPAYVLGIVLLAAFAGASIRRRPRRDRRELRVAPATLAGARAQRRMAARSRGAR